MNLRKIKWHAKTYQEYINYLKALKDDKYHDFSLKLTKTKYAFIGVRIPILRSIAHEISQGDYQSFLTYQTSTYFEEIMIEGLVIAEITDEELFDALFKAYILKIDNWSINDVFCNSLKIMNKNPSKYFKISTKLAMHKKEFMARVGLISILSHFVKKDNLKDIYHVLDNLKNNDYYTKMGAAWLMCECLIKYYQETIGYLKVSKLNTWTFNKGLQKARESFRLTDDQKKYLTSLKRSI